MDGPRYRTKSRPRRLAHADEPYADTRKRRRRFLFVLRRSRRTLLALIVFLLFLLALLVRRLPPPAARGVMGRSATPLARAARLAPQAPQAPRRVPRVPLPDDVRSAAHPVSGGMLRVDPTSAVHPVYQLIRDARAAWDAKVARQSTSLRQAADEYVRRYRRAPPAGFDRWWRYVV
jgi:hypothetical protein